MLSLLANFRTGCKLLIIALLCFKCKTCKILPLFFVSTCIVVAANTVQIRVRSHQLIKILTGDSYTYELCIWHSIDLYPMFAKLLCILKAYFSFILFVAGPILRLKRKYVFGNVWHCIIYNLARNHNKNNHWCFKICLYYRE